MELVVRVLLGYYVKVVRFCDVSAADLVWVVRQLDSGDYVLLIGIQNENVILLQT